MSQITSAGLNGLMFLLFDLYACVYGDDVRLMKNDNLCLVT